MSPEELAAIRERLWSCQPFRIREHAENLLSEVDRWKHEHLLVTKMANENARLADDALAEVERLTRRLNQDVGLLLGERDRALELSRSMAQEVHNAQARIDKVRALAEKMLSEHGQSWNSISGRRIIEALDGSDQ